jgi:hypothetical protein
LPVPTSPINQVARGNADCLVVPDSTNTDNGRLFYYLYKGDIIVSGYCRNYNIGGVSFIYTDNTNYYLYYKGELVKSGTYNTFESLGKSQEDMFFRIDGITYIVFYDTGHLVSYNI